MQKEFDIILEMLIDRVLAQRFKGSTKWRSRVSNTIKYA